VLVVTAEIWRGGDPKDRQVVGVLTLANVTEPLNELSDYEGAFVSPLGSIKDIWIDQHKRSDGVWELVRRAIEQQEP
jgi:hypothetical protein